MSLTPNLLGVTFGRLTVVSREEGEWRCLCSCGNYMTTITGRLTGGKTKSCGCLRRDAAKTTGSRNRTHGEAKAGLTPEYKAWQSMKARCSPDNPSEKHRRLYSGRGISVCSEWANSFEIFLAHVGRRPTSGYSLDRIDNDKNYEPGNVRWADDITQRNNQRRVKKPETQNV